MNNLTATLVNHMARRTGTELRDLHYEVLEYAFDYYEKNKVGPLYQNIKRSTGITKENIKALFPYGLNSVYVWVGIPIHGPNQSCKPMAKIKVNDYREVYLDHNATTYVRDEVKELLQEYYRTSNRFGNPSSSTNPGYEAYKEVKSAREKIAACLNAAPNEIVFTGSGSEANNMAIKGIAFQHLENKGHMITSRIEHSCVLKAAEFCESLGFDVTYLDVEPDGRVSPEKLKKALRKDTLLVSIMAVNNEIGTINPISEFGALCKQANIPFMVDATQGFGKIPLDPKAMDISLLSLSGHKIYAPKGVGALYMDRNVSLTPLIHGGGQENGWRSGTESVDHIIAFGKAAQLIHQERDSEQNRLRELRDYFLERLMEIEPKAILNGSLESRVPNNLNIGFPDIDSGSLLLSLNAIGVYVSSGSACHSGGAEASHVIKALGLDTGKYGTMRFSFGLRTTREDLDYLFKYLGELLEKLKEMKMKDASPHGQPATANPL